MATFANTSSAQQSNFRLKFRLLREQRQSSRHNAGTAYAWEHSGVAEVRVGPEPGENEELGETTRQLRNQCLFMRTLSVTLSDSMWAETFPGTVSAIIKKALNQNIVVNICILLTRILVLHRPTQQGLFKAGGDLLDHRILRWLKKKKTMRKVQL